MATITVPLTVSDLNRLEADRAGTGQRPTPEEGDRLLDLAMIFRNALREIQVSGNQEAKQIATRALSIGPGSKSR